MPTRPDRTAILLTHSASPLPSGWLAAGRRHGLVRAIVRVEPMGPPFADIPNIGAPGWGLAAAPLTFDPPRATPEAVRDADPATLRLPNLAGLPIAGVTGDSSSFAPASPPTVEAPKAGGAAAPAGSRCDLERAWADLRAEFGRCATTGVGLAELPCRRRVKPGRVIMDVGFIGLGAMGKAWRRRYASCRGVRPEFPGHLPKPLVEAVRRLMQACEQDASISPGASREDVLVLLSSVLRIAPTRDGRKHVTHVLTLISRSPTLTP